MMKKKVTKKKPKAAQAASSKPKVAAAAAATKAPILKLSELFRSTDEFDGKFFDSVFAHKTLYPSNEFLTLFQKAILEMDTELLGKIKECFDAQYARLPLGYERNR